MDSLSVFDLAPFVAILLSIAPDVEASGQGGGVSAPARLVLTAIFFAACHTTVYRVEAVPVFIKAERPAPPSPSGLAGHPPPVAATAAQDYRAVHLEPTRLRLDEDVLFDGRGARILPESYAVLDETARAIREHPALGRILVQVHADQTAAAVTCCFGERGQSWTIWSTAG